MSTANGCPPESIDDGVLGEQSGSDELQGLYRSCER